MSLDHGFADAGVHPGASSGAVRARRRIVASASVLAATALIIAGTAQPGTAATAGAWQTYTIASLSDGTLSGGIYAPSLNDAWAAGFTQGQSGQYTVPQTAYSHFNGSGWASVSGPDIGEALAIGGSSDNDVWVIGSTGSARYNGSAWTTYQPYLPAGDSLTGNGFPASVYSTGPDSAWAVIPVAGGTSQTLLEHFDGTSWSLASAPVTAGNTVSQLTGTGPDDVDAVTANDSAATAQILHFDGSSWSAETVPGLSGVSGLVPNLAVTGSGDALVTGLHGFLQSWAAEETSGTWSTTSLPESEFADSVTGGPGRAWAEMVNIGLEYAGLPAPETLWELSGGTWQQVSANLYPNITAVADGSGLWSYDASGGDSVALYAG